MAFAMAKARIGTTMSSLHNLKVELERRQEEFHDRNRTLADGEVPDGFVEQNGRLIPFWWSREGVIIKWSVFLGLLVLFTLYMTIGYFHAKRRVKKGLKPLGYHRFLLSRAELARVDPAYAYPQATYTNYAPGQHYGMQPMPLPVYDPSRPPMYQAAGVPPPPGTKVDPAQQQYAPPAGPPPGNNGGGNGQSNPFADPKP